MPQRTRDEQIDVTLLTLTLVTEECLGRGKEVLCAVRRVSKEGRGSL